MNANIRAVEIVLPDSNLLDESEDRSLLFDRLPDASSDSRLRAEWETYRTTVGRLLADGNAGRHVLIKANRIVGIWDRRAEAVEAGYQQFADEPFLVHEIRAREPIVRVAGVARCRG